MNDPNLTIENISTTLIDPFPYQARKHFREEGLAEMADSVREMGILEPLLGRRCPTNLKRVELIAGERRLRAAKLAGLATVPLILRELSDTAAEEVMLVENLQREDLSPVEEADALWRMLQLKKDDGSALYTLESLAKKIGKGVFEIRQAIKLRSAPAALLDALEEGTVSASIAAAVGRIPDPKAREAATKAILRPATQPVPLKYEQAVQLIRTEFMAKIPGAGFDPKDATLVPVKLEAGERVCGGSCEDCPFRSGNIKDIAEQLQGADDDKGKKGGRTAGVDPQLCTKPSCHAAKQDAQWERRKVQHLKDGGRVLTDAEAKKELGGYNGDLRYDSPFAELKDEPKYGVFNRYLDKKWSELLKDVRVTTTLAFHPKARKIVELITVKEAAEAVKAKFKEQGPSAAEMKTDEAQKAARAKELLAQKVDKQQWRLAFTAINKKVAGRGLGVNECKLLFQIVLDNAGADGMTVMGQWLDIKLPKGGHHSGRDYEKEILQRATNECTTVNAWLAWTVLASVAHSVKWSGARAEDLELVLEELGIDAKKLKSDATEMVKEATKKPEKSDKPVKKAAEKKPLQNDGMMTGRTLSGAKESEVKESLSFDEQVAMARSNKSWAEIIGPMPATGTKERKAWDALRVKIYKRATKAKGTK